MRVFKIPFDTKKEEKIFGGYLSIRQVIYLILLAITGTIFIIPIPIIFRILFFSLSAILFLSLAFFKINGQNFDRVFLLGLKYLLRKRKFVYERCCKC